jgi:prolyl-tRNA editing enzyme YbaK/EbsC (Cys-tRNA(Pro) deacylase)
MAEILTAAALQAFMNQREIPGEILILDVPTPTVLAAAKALGVEPQQIVKSVLFTLPGQAVLTISCGDRLVERRVIASLYGVSRKRIKLASADVVRDLTGFEVGTVPPFAHRQPIPTLLDPKVLTFDEIYAGGGTNNALVRLNPQDIACVTRAQIVDLHTKPT